MIAKTEEEANTLAEKVNVKNDLRREFDLRITEEAIAMIEADSRLRSAKKVNVIPVADCVHCGDFNPDALHSSTIFSVPRPSRSMILRK